MPKIKYIKSIIVIAIIIITAFATSMLNSNKITLIINNKTNKNIIHKSISNTKLKSHASIKIYEGYYFEDWR